MVFETPGTVSPGAEANRLPYGIVDIDGGGVSQMMMITWDYPLLPPLGLPQPVLKAHPSGGVPALSGTGM